MSQHLRWGLLLPFAGSIVLAAYAQYLFTQRNPLWYDSVVLYGVAVALFAWVAGQRQREKMASQNGPGDDLWRVAARIMGYPIGRLAWIGLALAVSFLSAREANRIPAPSSVTVVMSLWLVSLIAFACAFTPWAQIPRWRIVQVKRVRENLRPILPEIVLLVGIVLIAFVLRAFDLEHIPANLGGDEGEMGLQARAFLTGDLRDPFATSWMAHQTMWFFLQSLSLRLLGQTIPGLRMLSVLFGTLSILTTFLLVRELFNRTLALTTAAILAVSAFHLHFSRLAISSIGDPFWTSLVLFLLVVGLKTRRTGYFVAAGLALGFSQCFYHGMRLLLITLAVFLCYILLQDRRLIWSQLRNLVTMGVGAIVATAPLILYYIRFPELFVGHYNAMGIIPSGWLARTVQETGQTALAIILERTRRSFLFFNAYPEYSGFYAPQQQLLDSISAILFVFGVAYAIYRLKTRGFFLFLVWFALAMFFGAVLVIDENGVERFVTASVPVAFLVATALVKFFEVGARLLVLRPKWSGAVIPAVVVAIAALNLHFYFIEYLPQRLNSGIGAGRSTEMARLFLAQREPFRVYFFGAPDHYLNHGTIRYLVPNLDGMDVLEPLQGPPNFVDPSKRAIFVFHPMRAGEFEFVQRAYPSGARFDYRMDDGQELFFWYVVDQPQEISK